MLGTKNEFVKMRRESGHQLVLPVSFFLFLPICRCDAGTFDGFLFVCRALRSHDHEPGSAFIRMASAKGSAFSFTSEDICCQCWKCPCLLITTVCLF